MTVTTTPQDVAWLDHFAQVTRARVLDEWPRKSCVLSTRIGLDVLRYFGVQAEPQPVQVIAATKELFARISTGQPLDGVDGWSVGVAATGRLRGEPGRRWWDGHLVLVARPARGTARLVDLSVDQLHRPDKGIHLPHPLVAPFPDHDVDRWQTERTYLAIELETCNIAYRAQPDAGQFTEGTAWEPQRRATGDIIRQLRKGL